MNDADSIRPHTAHTTNPVPLVVTRPEASLVEGGEIGGLAPTVLRLLDLPVPPEMTGTLLVKP
jgi:2,3-bisphosphoglycerate-independent phosphoglycerate mutase